MSIYFHKPLPLFGSSLAGAEQEWFTQIRREIDLFYSNTGKEVVFDNFVKTLELIERAKSHLGLRKSSAVFQEIIFYLRAKLLSADPYIVRSTYILLDYLVKNGGPLIHNAINNVRVMKTITTIARINYFNDHGKGSKMVADCALDIIQGWGEAFEKEFKDTRYQNIINAFHNLRRKYGLVYPRKSYCSSRVKIFLGRSSKFRYEYDFVPEDAKTQEQSGSGRTAGFSDDPDLLEFSDLELGSPRDVLNETVLLHVSAPPVDYSYNSYHSAPPPQMQMQMQMQTHQHVGPLSYNRYDGGFDKSTPLEIIPHGMLPATLVENSCTDLRMLERDNADTLQLSLKQTSSSKKRQEDSYAISINEEMKSFDAIDIAQHRYSLSGERSQKKEGAYRGPSFSSRDEDPDYSAPQPRRDSGSGNNPFDLESPLHHPRPTEEPEGGPGQDRRRSSKSSYFDPSSDPDNVITFFGTQRVVRKAKSEKKSYAL